MRIAFYLCCALATVGLWLGWEGVRAARQSGELRQELEDLRQLKTREVERLADEAKIRTDYALWEADRTDEVVFRCDYAKTVEDGPYRLQDVFSINEKAGRVRLTSVDPPRPGVVLVSDSSYRLEFLENQPRDGYLLLKVEINRLTAKAVRVIGRDQTVSYQGQTLHLRAIRNSGECVRMNAL